MEIDVTSELYTYNKNFETIKKQVLENNVISICGIPSSGRLRLIKQVLHSLKIQVYKFIDLKSLLNKDSFELDKLALDNELKESQTSEMPIVLEGFDYDTSYINEIISYFENFRRSAIKRFPIIFSLSSSPTLYKEIINKGSIIFSNVFYIDVNDTEFQLVNLEHNQSRFEIILDNAQIQQMEQLTGYIPSLTKRYFQLILANKNTQDVGNYEDVLKQIFESIGFKEIFLLKSIAVKKNIDQHELEELRQIGWIKESINSSLVNTYVLNYHSKYNLYYISHQIYRNTQNITTAFTEKEFQILKSLITNKSISRNEIAKVIFKNEEQFSLSALEKFISRLRVNLSKQGFHKDIIQTKSKFGYSLNNRNE